MEKIAETMVTLSKEKGRPFLERDANNVRNSGGLVLIGINEHATVGLDCGACGFAKCAEFAEAQQNSGDYDGPNCMFKLVDLGIALGSAVKTAQMNNADNRIMYTAGIAAKRAGVMNARVIMGVPISATGKNIYFDRK